MVSWMKILHIAPNSPYNDYWGYQDNLLPKYQRKLGYNVTIVVPTLTHKDGQVVETDEMDYVLSDGVRVIRRKYKDYRTRWITNRASYIYVYDLLCEIKPDFVFYHGLVSTTIRDVVKYKKKNSECIVVQDNHLDYNIGPKTDTFKEKMSRWLYRKLNSYSVKYVERIYGVTPWRKKYAEDYFGIPSSKTDVLIMGADDEKIHFDEYGVIRNDIRSKYGIREEEFLIVTGGKIDRKKGVHLLASACREVGPNVKLLIFGQIMDDVKEELESTLSKSNNIINVGWIDADQVYDYFFAADLCFFPGQHSVLWEQACACKVPCVFKRWAGMEHVNNGGNSEFLDDVSETSIKAIVRELRFTDRYFKMKQVAESNAADIYLYSNIAKKSVECL